MFSIQAGHIPLDAETLPQILKRAGLVPRRNLSEEDYVQAVWQNFDFSHIGFASLEQLSTEEVKWSGRLGKVSQRFRLTSRIGSSTAGTEVQYEVWTRARPMSGWQ
ncbi:hypothetical protein Unana1_05827 [Umbelopsis nana]